MPNGAENLGRQNEVRMKKYFVLEVSDESAAEYPAKYNWDHPHSGPKLRDYTWKHKDFPSWTPMLELEIYDDPQFNKLNDFIHGPIQEFCVSKRVKEVLQQFNLPKHKFYPVTVYMPEKKFLGLLKGLKKLDDEYFAFHFDCLYISDTSHFVDFDKTQFTNNNMDYEKTDEVFFNKSFDQTLDLFQLPLRLSRMTYISEELMLKLKEINAIGAIFSKINEHQYRVPRPNPKLTWL